MQLSGKDAVAKVQSLAAKISSGARAIALLPAPSGQRIPIRILDVPTDRRGVIEETLRTNIKDVDLVGPEQPARFAVDMEGETLRLLAADGLEVVGSFGLNEPWGAGVATVVSRSSNASELLTLDNPSSLLKVDVRVASAPKTRGSVSARGVKVVADTQAAKYRIRKQGNPRTEQNSLQLEVRVSADAYVTIVDVDSEGGVNLLFPNSYQNRQYHGDGFVRAGEAVLIPDSLKPGNESGFYWDYSPPKGTDTIRVFSSTDLQTAQMIRDRVSSLQGTAGNASVTLKTRAIASGMQSLRQQLTAVAARGILTVPDTSAHVPGGSSPVLPDAGQSSVGPPAVENPLPPTPDAVPAASVATIPESAAAPPTPPADWAATSITIAISE
jgi:hypothetical protein